MASYTVTFTFEAPNEAVANKVMTDIYYGEYPDGVEPENVEIKEEV
jgi:hypothetical protein